MSKPTKVKIYTHEEVKNTIIPDVECRFCGESMKEYDFYYDRERDIITREFRRKCDKCYKDDYYVKKLLVKI